jgi:hypothetical protein
LKSTNHPFLACRVVERHLLGGSCRELFVNGRTKPLDGKSSTRSNRQSPLQKETGIFCIRFFFALHDFSGDLKIHTSVSIALEGSSSGKLIGTQFFTPNPPPQAVLRKTSVRPFNLWDGRSCALRCATRSQVWGWIRQHISDRGDR